MTTGPLENGFTGGCQCGALRYAVAPGPVRQSVCHCRMCQRATSNAFAPLVEAPHDRITWHGTPTIFASSNLGERGFCAACGAPIFLRSPGGDSTEFMAGSLDAPQRFAPEYNYGTESRLHWSRTLTALDDRETTLPEGITLTSFQSEPAQ